MQRTDPVPPQTVSFTNDVQRVLLAVLAALFSLGCMTWSTMVEVTRGEDGQQHLVGTSIQFEFDKGVWDALEPEDRTSLAGIGDGLKQQGWTVQTGEGGRITNATRSPATLEALKEQGWSVAEQPLETGRIITATLPFLSIQGTASEDPAKEAIQNIVVRIDESDPAATRYTYRTTVLVDVSEQAPDSGSGAPPPAEDASWGDLIGSAIEDSPEIQRLEAALEKAGPPKIVVGATLPGAIESATINGAPGGAVEGSTVRWTIVAEKSGNYSLEATALGAETELVITDFQIEGSQEETPEGSAYVFSDTWKLNVRVAGQDKETKEQDFKKHNPVDVKLYYDDKEVDSGQTDGEGNVSFSFRPPDDTADGVSEHTLKVVASKERLPDAEDSRSIRVIRGKKEGEVDLQLDHMEVVQVIQTADNKIPLVAGKKTVVRVFVKADNQSEQLDVKAALYIWPEGKSEVELKPINSVLLNPGSSHLRSDTHGSINFVVPPELTAAGVFSLRAVINPDHSIEESDYDNNRPDPEPFEFVERNGLRVGFVRIGYKTPGMSDWAWPRGPIGTYDSFMRTIFPVADAKLQYYELPWRVRQSRPLTGDATGEDLNWTLREFYDRIEGDKPDLLLGWIPGYATTTSNERGLAEVTLDGQVARVAWLADQENAQTITNVAHELGHNMGVDHTGTTSDPAPCVLARPAADGYWPAEYGGSAAIREVGFDTSRMQAIPGSYYDFMSYCYNTIWIAPYHYMKLYNSNLRPQAGLYTMGRVARFLVRGRASLAGDAARLEIVRFGEGSASSTEQSWSLPLLPGAAAARHFPGLAGASILPLPGPAQGRPLREGTGNHCLHFFDASGATLYERCFNLTFLSAESREQVEQQGFVLEVADPGGVARVALVRNEGMQSRELTSLQVSSQAPIVAITSPRAGDTWEGEHTIAWTGSDPDGDELRYDIQYSADGKKSWYPIEVGSRETRYTFSTEEILPSDLTYIRVTASDGFNTASTDVGPLVVPKQPNSPSPPPALPAETIAAAAAGGFLGMSTTGMIVAAVGAGLLLVVGFAVVRTSRRRPRLAAAAGTAASPIYTQPVAAQPAQLARQAPSPIYTQPAPDQPADPARTAAPPIYTPPSQPAQPAQPAPAASPPYSPPAPPQSPPQAYAPQAVAMNPYQHTQMQYGRLQAELGAGRMNQQQYEAAVNTLRVLDEHGRYWQLGAYDGLWYVYDGRSWMRANPP